MKNPFDSLNGTSGKKTESSGLHYSFGGQGAASFEERTKNHGTGSTFPTPQGGQFYPPSATPQLHQRPNPGSVSIPREDTDEMKRNHDGGMSLTDTVKEFGMRILEASIVAVTFAVADQTAQFFRRRRFFLPWRKK